MSSTPLLAQHRADGGALASHGAERKSEEVCGSAALPGAEKQAVSPASPSPADDEPNNRGGSSEDAHSVGKKPNAHTLADAAARVRWELRNPAVARIGEVFANIAHGFATNPEDRSVRARLVEAARSLDLVTKDTPEEEDVRGILLGAKSVLADELENMEILRIQALNFCDFAAVSSLANAALDFSRAVEGHAAGNDRGKRVAETALQKAGMRLFQAATQAPHFEAALAKIAHKLTQDSDMILLTPDDLSGSCQCCPGCCSRCWCWCCSGSGSGFCASLLKWIKSGPERTLPVHHSHQTKLPEKRQVLFGVALAAIVAFLTSAASVKALPSEYAPWIAGATVLVWVVVSAGMVSNLYGTTYLELMAAAHLGRLGIISVCVLMCVYAFWIFFPTHSYIFWILLVCVGIFHGGLFIWSCTRSDENSLDTDEIAETPERTISSDNSEQV